MVDKSMLVIPLTSACPFVTAITARTKEAAGLVGVGFRSWQTRMDRAR